MTIAQFLFFCSLFVLGGYLGGLSGYVLLADRHRQRKAQPKAQRSRHRSTK